MQRIKDFIKYIVTDIVGVLLIIGSIVFGWIPGPGGIPLFLAGLGLLAVNHNWAKNLLVQVKQEGTKFISKVFSDHPYLVAAYDVLSFILVGVALYLINTYTKNITLSIAIVMLAAGISLFMGNRKRLEKLVKWAKRQ